MDQFFHIMGIISWNHQYPDFSFLFVMEIDGKSEDIHFLFKEKENIPFSYTG